MTSGEGKKTNSVTIAPEVFALMAAHASSHPTSAVHGVLVGIRNGDAVSVKDAFPICHEHPTKTLVETSLALVQSTLEETKDSIVGWFTAPELLHETKPGPVALRVVANLAAAMGGEEPILLVLNNEAIVEMITGEGCTTASKTIQAFGKDFGMQWMEPIEKFTVSQDARATKAAIALVKEGTATKDLVDHWGEGIKSEWTLASSLSSFTSKFT